MTTSPPITLVVQCPNGRRQSVKIQQNCSILQVLEEVCNKQSLNPSNFDIRHYNKILDLSLPIYFANLANNALLELRPTREVREDSFVTVGLQIEPGERYTKDFMPSSTIWDVVEQCLALKTDDLKLAEEGDQPICIYMRQKIQGEDLKTTTLRSLGLTKGTAIIRLIYRKPRLLENQAHISAPLSKPSFEELKLSFVESKSSAEPKSFIEPNTFPKAKSSYVEPMAVSEGDDSVRPATPSFEGYIKRKQARIEDDADSKEITTHNSSYVEWKQNGNTTHQTFGVRSLDNIPSTNSMNFTEPFLNKTMEKVSADEFMDTENCQMDQDASCDEIGPVHYIGERHAVLYSLEDITDVKKADLPDEFFELTIDDVRYLMEEYKKNRIEMENQPLLTKVQRKRKVLHNLAYYRQTVIRVYFPDKLVLQAVFNVDETVQVLSNFLRNFLEDKNLNFYLYITPPKEVLNSSKTLLEALLVPAAVVYFGCDVQCSTYLKYSLKNQISDPRAASLAASESRKQSLSDMPLEIELPDIETSSLHQNIVDSAVPSTSVHRTVPDSKPFPKWLKLSRK